MTQIHTIRNIGIIAHIDAGKTTLSERMLFYSRKIHRMGEVHNGAATMDYLPEEQERGITITSACTSCEWHDHLINLVDTPGHVDFTIEVERCLRVLDGAVGVFCAVGGVEPQSETVWRQSEHFGVPKIAFINKLDRLGADFDATLTALRERLHAPALAVTAPLGQGENFCGVLDLITEESLLFDASDQGQSITRAPFTPDEAAVAAPYREYLLEKLAEADDAFLEPYLENNFTISHIRAALRRTTLARTVTPVLCGSALRNAGIQPVLDAVCAYLPSPADGPVPLGHDTEGGEVFVPPDPTAPTAALVFKVLMENGRKLSFVRIYAGRLKEGDVLCRSGHSGHDGRSGRGLTATNEGSARDGNTEDRAGRIYRLHADRREQLDVAVAGEIAAVVGLRSAKTGDTYTARERRIVLESIEAYAPVLTLALEPRNADEGKTLDEALTRYAEEDPTLRVSMDEESGSRMISGMGELHLDVLLERIKREYGISPRAGHPQVVLRETVRKEAEAAVFFERDLGKEHHQGSVALRVAPRPRGSGNVVETGDFLPPDAAEARKILPLALLDAALEGIRDGLQSGELTGWPVEDVAVTLINVERREGLTTVPGCRLAAVQAVREAIKAASAVALEPVMRVEILTPDQALGASVNLFNSCGGKVDDMQEQAGRKVLRGTAPLRRLFGFSTALRSATQGRAGLVLAFDRFDLP